MSQPQLESISQWTIPYILDLPRGEFDWLDFKSSAWLSLDADCLEKLSRYISAWSNYEGGYLIVGISDPIEGDLLKIDSGVELTIKGGLKGWLEDKLPNLVEESLPQIDVQTIPFDDEPKRGLVIIHVPPSEIAPHQARDRKFYTRLGSKLHPLPRRAIFDIANRRKHPVVTSSVTITLFNPDFDERGGLVWTVTNNSDVFCQHVVAEIKIPMKFRGIFLHVEDTYIDTHDSGEQFYVLKLGNNINAPLFPRGSLTRRCKAKLLSNITTKAGKPLDKTISSIAVRTFADAAPYVDQALTLEEAIRILPP